MGNSVSCWGISLPVGAAPACPRPREVHDRTVSGRRQRWSGLSCFAAAIQRVLDSEPARLPWKNYSVLGGVGPSGRGHHQTCRCELKERAVRHVPRSPRAETPVASRDLEAGLRIRRVHRGQGALDHRTPSRRINGRRHRLQTRVACTSSAVTARPGR